LELCDRLFPVNIAESSAEEFERINAHFGDEPKQACHNEITMLQEILTSRLATVKNTGLGL